MSKYCCLPTESQRLYAEYLKREYGRALMYRYLAVVTNPNPSNYGNFKGSANAQGQLPQLELFRLRRGLEQRQG